MSTTTTLSDPPRRGLRTLLQAVLALAAAVPASAAALGLSAADTARVGAICAIATAVVSVLVNALEDANAIPALLKAVPSSGASPVPDPVDDGDDGTRFDRGHVTLAEGVVLVAVALLLFYVLAQAGWIPSA